MTASPAPLISVRVLVFAKFAELLAREEIDVTIAPPATVGDVIAKIRASIPAAKALPPELLCARNRAHASPSDTVSDGDELALLPPLAGG